MNLPDTILRLTGPNITSTGVAHWFVIQDDPLQAQIGAVFTDHYKAMRWAVLHGYYSHALGKWKRDPGYIEVQAHTLLQRIHPEMYTEFMAMEEPE